MAYQTDDVICHLLRRRLKAKGMVVKELAAALGEGAGVVQRKLDPNDNYTFSAGSVPDLCAILGDDLIEFLAVECGGHYVPFLKTDPDRLSDEHYAALVAKFGDLLRALGEAFDPRGEQGRTVSAHEAQVVFERLRMVGQLVESLMPYYQHLATEDPDNKGGKS